MSRPTGLTADVDWQIGVSRTLRHSPEEVRALLTSPHGIATWLGAGATLAEQKAASYGTAEGTTGEVRSFRPLDRIRLTWRPPDWSHEATLQVAISRSATGTLVRFHQEHLADAEERERMRAHWRGVLEELTRLLD